MQMNRTIMSQFASIGVNLYLYLAIEADFFINFVVWTYYLLSVLDYMLSSLVILWASEWMNEKIPIMNVYTAVRQTLSFKTFL